MKAGTVPSPPDFSLTGKTVLITGASSGIGRGIASAAAARGATIIAIGRNAEALDALKTELTECSSASHACIAFDVAECSAIPELVKSLVLQYGPIGGFVHSAGILEHIPLKLMNADLYHRFFQVNVISGFEFVRSIASPKHAAPNLSCVFISSVAAVRGEPGLLGYAASKGALVAGTLTLAAELARKNIRVNCLLPGQVMGTKISEQQKMNLSAEAFQHLADTHPLGLGNVEDIAGAAIFLLSDASRWITGSSLPVDGGYCVR